jgi:hypothetical protein
MGFNTKNHVIRDKTSIDQATDNNLHSFAVHVFNFKSLSETNIYSAT